MLRLIPLMFCMLVCFAFRARADEAFEMESIVLLNPMSEFGKRAPATKTTSAYINAIKAKVGPIVSKAYANDKTARNGIIAVAVRPDGSSKYWIDVDGEFFPKRSEQLATSMKQVGTPTVIGGPIAFIMQFHVWGGKKDARPKNPKMSPSALPVKWREAGQKANRKLRLPDEMLPLVWPEKAPGDAPTKPKLIQPEGFVLQTLNPTGGSILRPQDWHYAENHRRNTLDWTISKEPAKTPYITGVKIQLAIGIQKATKKTAKEFIAQFIESKKKAATKVLSETRNIELDIFDGESFDTIEPQPGKKDAQPFRVSYSCFWSEEVDIAAIIISGTTSDLWGEHKDTFKTMSGVKLIDLSRVKAKAK